MRFRNTTASWGAVAKFLHWLIALLVVGMLALGFYMAEVLEGFTSERFALFQWHKSFGILVLTLMVLRLLWRLSNPTPGPPATSPDWERWAARASHAAFYAILIAMPLSGWAMSSASPTGIKTVVFDLFTLPPLVAQDEGLEELFHEIHESLAYGLIALMVIHIAAALRHHVKHRDDVLVRMLPFDRG